MPYYVLLCYYALLIQCHSSFGVNCKLRAFVYTSNTFLGRFFLQTVHFIFLTFNVP